MGTKVLTDKVREGLTMIDMEMRATIDTMADRPEEKRAILAALDWIDAQVWRLDRRRVKEGGAQ